MLPLIAISVVSVSIRTGSRRSVGARALSSSPAKGLRPNGLMVNTTAARAATRITIANTADVPSFQPAEYGRRAVAHLFTLGLFTFAVGSVWVAQACLISGIECARSVQELLHPRV